MERCDVLIVGGGPAGSSCAWGLHQAGLDVVVMDKLTFPRDKVCAGWITPAVIEALDLDIEAYRHQRVFQPITDFRIGLMDGPMHEIHHTRAVSYGIRRREFDDYLLTRSGARLRLGEPVERLERTGTGWVVNAAIQTPLIVGAGGHFCPVARTLGAAVGRAEQAVHAQECEFAIAASQQTAYRTPPGMAELYFCRDLKGYGWCMRKGDFINIGLGREDDHALAQHVKAFAQLLAHTGRLPSRLPVPFKGHAYLVYPHARRRFMDDGVLLIGDAAGLAYPQSGEGIRPAIESGLIAAATILQADGRYARDALAPYTRQVAARFGDRNGSDWSDRIPSALKSRLAERLMTRPWFVRHIVLERGFLHTQEPALQIMDKIAQLSARSRRTAA